MPPRRETTVVLVHHTDTGVEQARLSAEEIREHPHEETGDAPDELIDLLRTGGDA